MWNKFRNAFGESSTPVRDQNRQIRRSDRVQGIPAPTPQELLDVEIQDQLEDPILTPIPTELTVFRPGSRILLDRILRSLAEADSRISQGAHNRNQGEPIHPLFDESDSHSSVLGPLTRGEIGDFPNNSSFYDSGDSFPTLSSYQGSGAYNSSNLPPLSDHYYSEISSHYEQPQQDLSQLTEAIIQNLVQLGIPGNNQQLQQQLQLQNQSIIDQANNEPPNFAPPPPFVPNQQAQPGGIGLAEVVNEFDPLAPGNQQQPHPQAQHQQFPDPPLGQGLPFHHNQNYNSGFNMSTGIQMSIFDTTLPNCSDAHSFIDSFSRWCSVQPGEEWNDAKKLKILPIFLRGSSLYFFNQYEATHRAAESWDCLTFAKFKEDFIKAFPSTAGQQQLEEKLMNRVLMVNEPLESYLYNIYDLISKVDPTMSFDRRLMHVRRGLPNVLQMQLQLQNPRNTENLTKTILTIGQAFVGTQQPQMMQGPMQNYGCGNPMTMGMGPPMGMGTNTWAQGAQYPAQNVSQPQNPISSQLMHQNNIALQSVLEVLKSAQNQTKPAASSAVKQAMEKAEKIALDDTINKINEKLSKMQSYVLEASNIERENRNQIIRGRNQGFRQRVSPPNYQPNPQSYVQNPRVQYPSSYPTSQWPPNQPTQWARFNMVDTTPVYDVPNPVVYTSQQPAYPQNPNPIRRQGLGNDRRPPGRNDPNAPFRGQSRDGSGRPLCFLCQKPGHLKYDCFLNPLNPNNRLPKN